MRTLIPVMAAASLIALSACTAPPSAETETPPATAPDPDAPAPGTQAAEAIGIDAISAGSKRP